MATTYEKIATVTVGSGGASTIEFTSIPSIYTDIVLKVSTRDSFSSNYANMIIKINGVTTSQSNRALLGIGSGTPTSFSDTPLYAQIDNAANSTASTFSNAEIYIPNYASSSAYKSVSIDGVTENNATAAAATLVAGLYASNTAVSSITLAPNSGTFNQHSSATLYGIKNS